MKKSWISFICILLCVLIPFSAVASVIFFVPSQFGQTFLGALSTKMDRISSVDEPKIIVVGGSSVPFGLDSKLMEEMLGMPVVNFGLYATLGTKLMLDLSEEYIGEGDIIVLAPETDAQTYSLFFGAEAAWQAADSDLSLLPKIAADNFGAMFGAAWKYGAQKLKYYIADPENPLSPDGIYRADSFDEYGDIVYPREYNKMALMYDSTLEIKLSADIISEDFVDYVNAYVEKAEKKGAKVLFSFAPMNDAALAADTTLESLADFESYIAENFDAELISNPNNYIYESGYFYDSNFHLNDAGAVMHTANLAYDIAEYLGKDLLKEVEIPDVPEVPEVPEDITPDYPTEYDENEKYFVFEEKLIGGELVGYNIVGISELGKAQSTLTTSYAYEGMRVYEISENAFAGCASLTDIYVTENISNIADGAFAGVPTLKKVHIMATNPDNTAVNNLSGELCRGMAADAKFYVKAELLDTFRGNYFWGPYADRIVMEDIVVNDEPVKTNKFEFVIIFAVATICILLTIFMIKKKKRKNK
ncbi:MAG: leucine-rich repeat protein [Clostridia bacterium]|nr:leucine-rich repeat protein [Clostridia bacterium]